MFEGGCMDAPEPRCHEPGCDANGYGYGLFCFVHQQICHCGHHALTHFPDGRCGGTHGQPCDRGCMKYERSCDYLARRRRIDDAADDMLALLRNPLHRPLHQAGPMQWTLREDDIRRWFADVAALLARIDSPAREPARPAARWATFDVPDGVDKASITGFGWDGQQAFIEVRGKRIHTTLRDDDRHG